MKISNIFNKFEVLADHKVKLKESERKDKYVVPSISFQTFLYRHLKLTSTLGNSLEIGQSSHMMYNNSYSGSNSLRQGWSCGLVNCPGGNATDPICKVLASSDGISS